MSVKATFYMRVYNIEAKMLRRAIESVLNQTESNLRFIIQDNGSTDGSCEIIKEYADKDRRVDWFRNEINSWATEKEWQQREETLYRNFEECDSKYFAIIDSDDYYELEFLEKAYGIAEDQNADIVFTGYKQVDVNGRELTKKIPPQVGCSVQEMTEDIYIGEYPMIRTLWGNLYAKKIWRRYWNLLDVDRPEYMKNGLDTYINLKLLKEIKKFISIDESLYSQTIRDNSIYQGDLRSERILEADCLFIQGIELAQRAEILNERMLTFLASVYYYHIKDIIDGVLRHQGKQKEYVVEIKLYLQKSQVFNMLSEKNRDLQVLFKMLN